MSSYVELKHDLINRHNELIDQLETKYSNYIQELLDHKKRILLQMQHKFNENMEHIHNIDKYGPTPSMQHNLSDHMADNQSPQSIPLQHQPLIQQHHQHVLQQMEASFASNMKYIEELRKSHNISSFSTSIQTHTVLPIVNANATTHNQHPHTSTSNPLSFDFDALEKCGKSQNTHINHLSLNLDANTNKNLKRPLGSLLNDGNSMKKRRMNSSGGGTMGMGMMQSFSFQHDGEFALNNNATAAELQQFDCNECQKTFMLKSDFDSHTCKKQQQFLLSPNDIMPKINDN